MVPQGSWLDPLLASGFSGVEAASIPIFDVSGEVCGASIPGIWATPETPRASAARASVESHREFGFLLEVLGFGVDSVRVSPVLLCSTMGFEVIFDVTDLFATDCPLYRSPVV